MADVQIINKFGKVQGWNSITFNWMGRDVEGLLKIAYNDTIAKENVYASGKYPVGRSEGNYSATFSFSVLKEEADLLEASIPPGMRFQDIAPSDPIVEWERKNGLIGKDIIHNVEIVERGVEVEQEDGTVEVPFTCITSHITWNAA